MHAIVHQMVANTLPYLLLVPAAVLLEYLSPMSRYTLRDRLPGALFVPILPIGAVLVALPVGAIWKTFGFVPVIHLGWLPGWAVVAMFVVVRDFLNYWMHRFDHAVMWPIHCLHHSPTELHAANAWAHPLAWLSEFAWLAVPLSFTDLGAQPPLTVSCIMMLQAFLIHSPLRVHLGPLRHVFVDQRFHRIHHSLEPQHFDKNYGIIFTVWDRLFGTAYFPREDEWPATGVAGLPPPKTLWQFLLFPVRQVRSRQTVAKAPALDGGL